MLWTLKPGDVSRRAALGGTEGTEGSKKEGGLKQWKETSYVTNEMRQLEKKINYNPSKTSQREGKRSNNSFEVYEGASGTSKKNVNGRKGLSSSNLTSEPVQERPG